MDRRDFAKILATTVLTSVSCKRPEINLINKVKPINAPQYENIYEYCSTFPHFPLPIPIIVETYQGIPFWIRGNESDLTTFGKIPPIVFASKYNLFDRHRIVLPKVEESATDIESALSQTFQRIDETIGKWEKVVIFTTLTSSPFLQKIVHEIENSNHLVEIIQLPIFDFFKTQSQANQKLYGKNIFLVNDLSEKQIIVNFGQDFLHHDPLAHYYTPRFDKAKHFLITFEDILSLTGINSDIRIVANEAEILRYAVSLLKELISEKGLNSLLDNFNQTFPQEILLPIPEKISKILKANPENIVFLCNPFYSTETQVITSILNELCNLKPKFIFDLSQYSIAKQKFDEFIQLGVDNSLLLFIDYNPYFSLNKALVDHLCVGEKNIIQLSIYRNELTKFAKVFIPLQTFFEFSLDYQAPNGTILAQQKLIEPVNKNSISAVEFLFRLKNHLQKSNSPHNYEQELFNFYFKGKDKKIVEKNLQNGFFIRESQKTSEEIDFQNSNFIELFDLILNKISSKEKAFKIRIIPHFENYFFEYANNPYLKEIPEPISGIAWSSPVFLHSSFNAYEKIQEFGKVAVVNGERKFVLPTYIPKDFLVKSNFIIYRNYNYFKEFLNIEQSEILAEFVSENFQLEGDFKLLTPNETLPILLRFSQVSDFPNFQRIETSHKNQMYTNQKIDQSTQWAMVIDLDKCIGCNACVIACQIENNIPVVGKHNVLKNRDLFWINIPKIKIGTKVKFLPILCQHCDNAPCESVCPVGATSHNTEGINEMTYNQCIGSRFCMVNCPYSVRKFNFEKPEKLHPNYIPEMMNPFVSIRSRGVSEKCTFCIQRINFERTKAKLFGDETNFDVKTACEEVCPVGAIKFSRKQKLLSQENRNNLYILLPEFNTKPSVYYEMTTYETKNS